MLYIVNVLFRITLLKSEPSKLPYSKWLLYILCIVDLLIGAGVNRLVANIAIQQARFQTDLNALTLIDFVIIGFVKFFVMLACIYGLLAFYKFKERFVQVTSAMIGVNIILSIYFLISVFLMQLTAFAFILFFMLIYWNFMIFVIIFKKSFNIAYFKAGFFALLYMLLQHNVGELVFKQLINLA